MSGNVVMLKSRFEPYDTSLKDCASLC